MAVVAVVLLLIAFVALPRSGEGTDAGHPRVQGTGAFRVAQTPGLVSDDMIVQAIHASDDFALHRDAFVSASRAFLAVGGSLSDLVEMGGWVRSQSHKPRRVYFTYRHPGDIPNRWYFDLDTGRTFQ